MYNMNVVLTYHTLPHDMSETQYRKELLNVFDLQTFDIDKINQEIEKVFHEFQENAEFIQCMKNKALTIMSTDNVVGFMLCFSFDEFHIVHEFILEYISQGTINMELLHQLDVDK